MKYQVNIQLIRKTRIEKKITLKQMAIALGIDSKASYYKREIGKTNFKSSELPVVSEMLDLSFEKIFVKTFLKSKQKTMQ